MANAFLPLRALKMTYFMRVIFYELEDFIFLLNLFTPRAFIWPQSIFFSLVF